MSIGNILEILKSEMFLSFYMKFSIMFICRETLLTRLKPLAKQMKYHKNKKSIREVVKDIIWTSILFVPYVGWIVTILYSIGCTITTEDENTIRNSDYWRED